MYTLRSYYRNYREQSRKLSDQPLGSTLFHMLPGVFFMLFLVLPVYFYYLNQPFGSVYLKINFLIFVATNCYLGNLLLQKWKRKFTMNPMKRNDSNLKKGLFGILLISEVFLASLVINGLSSFWTFFLFQFWIVSFIFVYFEWVHRNLKTISREKYKDLENQMVTYHIFAVLIIKIFCNIHFPTERHRKITSMNKLHYLVVLAFAYLCAKLAQEFYIMILEEREGPSTGGGAPGGPKGQKDQKKQKKMASKRQKTKGDKPLEHMKPEEQVKPGEQGESRGGSK
ncbi:unnamed protein product [Caenorhabditis brenneri]